MTIPSNTFTVGTFVKTTNGLWHVVVGQPRSDLVTLRSEHRQDTYIERVSSIREKYTKDLPLVYSLHQGYLTWCDNNGRIFLSHLARGSVASSRIASCTIEEIRISPQNVAGPKGNPVDFAFLSQVDDLILTGIVHAHAVPMKAREKAYENAMKSTVSDFLYNASYSCIAQRLSKLGKNVFEYDGGKNAVVRTRTLRNILREE